MLTKDSIEEIEKLQVHILKSCLSGITVGGGTNKNEAFHRYVRTFFHKSRIGILLAYALMTTIISNFNNNDKQSRKNRLRSIRLSLQTHEVGKPLGIMDDNKDEDLTWIQEQDEDDIDTISIDNILRVSSQFTICKATKNQIKTSTQIWKYIPYIQILPNQLPCEEHEVEAHKERLRNNASAWNFQYCPCAS